MTEYEEEDVKLVALFTRAWIEMIHFAAAIETSFSRPLHEGVD